MVGKQSLSPLNSRKKPNRKIAGCTQYQNHTKKLLSKNWIECVTWVALNFQPESEGASPSLITSKKDGTVHFLANFREVNEWLVRKSFLLTKISTVLQELEGFTYCTARDWNMGYYTICFDPDRSKVFTLIFLRENTLTSDYPWISQVLQISSKLECLRYWLSWSA